MEPISTSVPAVAVALIFRLWQLYRAHQYQRQRRLRERVAYMLWSAAQQVA